MAHAMTLVEVLVVVAILGLLATVLTVGVTGALGKGKREIAKTGIGLVQQKVETYRVEHGQWPPTDVGLAALSDGHAKPTTAYYLKPEQLRDPWGQPYYFIVPGPDDHPYEIVSYGADAQPGGEDENADITSINLSGAAP
tara:strand:- start:2142 stop:2561 length:420 start_codon:yes stop_codon:yes gene_type:complete